LISSSICSPAFVDVRHQLGSCAGNAKVDCNCPRFAKFSGKRVQPLFPARHQNQPMSALRQLPGELGP